MPRSRPRRRRDCFFGLHFDLHPGKADTELGKDLTEEMVDRLLSKVRPDYVQYDCKGHPGYAGYPTRVGTPSPGIVRDSLAVWRKVTGKRGVGLYVHYSGVWDSVAIEKHPDWARIDAEGRPDKDSTSTFGPYCDELLIPQMKELIDLYDVDGAWVDGDCWAVKPDFGPAARTAYKQRKGLDKMPTNSADPGWPEMLEFQREAFRQYVRRYVDALHEYKSTFQIASNWLYTSLSPDPPTVPVDFISGDYSPGDSVNTARLNARYMASTGLPWDLMAWGFNKGRDCGWSLKTPIQLKQEASIVLGQGGEFQIYYNPTRAGWIDDWMIKIMAEVAKFCRARKALSRRTQTVPQVALVLSRSNLYGRSDRLFGGWDDLMAPINGMLHALLELHCSVDVLAEHQLVPKLDQYPLVVLPECVAIAEDFRGSLMEYVARGGSLLLVGAEVTNMFEDYLLVEFTGQPADRQNMYLQAEGSLAWVGGLWQRVQPGDSRILGWGYPSSDTRGERICAAAMNDHHKGSLGSIFGPFGTVYHRSHNPVARRFLLGVVKRLFPRPMVELRGPPCVDVSLRRKDGRLLVHLSNTANMQVAPEYPITDFVPPLGRMTVRTRTDSEADEAFLEPGHQRLASHRTREGLQIEIPSLHLHSVVSLLP